MLKTADNGVEIGVSMFAICNDEAVCVVSRREYYAGTNLQALPAPTSALLPCVNTTPPIVRVWISRSTSDYYRVFHRNTCYELRLSIAESSFANLDPTKVKELTREDEGRVQSELIAILDSFRLL